MTPEQIETLKNVAAYMRMHQSDDAAEAIEAAVALIERLWLTGDGQRCDVGMRIWYEGDDNKIESQIIHRLDPDGFVSFEPHQRICSILACTGYSTRDAALAAKEAKP